MPLKICRKSTNSSDILMDASKVNPGNCAMDAIINKFMINYEHPIEIPYIIGICGGSGSGKTFIADLIVRAMETIFGIANNKNCANTIVISQDSYYKGGNNDTNYDIPSAIDFELFIKQLNALIKNESIECPIYDFKTHRRKQETKMIRPAKIIIVEGILIFTQEPLRKLFNMKIFVNADEPTQIFRRTVRDIEERGRTLSEVRERYERDVWPSYKKYVSTSAMYADMQINNSNNCYTGPEIMLNHIVAIFKKIYGSTK